MATKTGTVSAAFLSRAVSCQAAGLARPALRPDHGSGSRQRRAPSGRAARQSQMAEEATAHTLCVRILINITKCPLLLLHCVCVNAPFSFLVLQDLGYKHGWRMSSKANCFPLNLWKTVCCVSELCTHLFSLCFFCLAFELVELFTPPYPSSSPLKRE